MADAISIIGAICWIYIGFTIYGWIQDYREKKRHQKWKHEYDELVKSFPPNSYCEYCGMEQTGLLVCWHLSRLEKKYDKKTGIKSK